MVPPDKAYMPGKGIGGLLPEINIRIPDSQEGRDLATFLTQILGVRETVHFLARRFGRNGLKNCQMQLNGRQIIVLQ